MKRRMTSIFLCLVMVAAVFAVAVPMSIGAEEEPEFPEETPEPWNELENGWSVDVNGTYFEITNSSYLNITLTSSENVHVHLESLPNIISFHIEPNCTATSTDITITGFEANKKYYRYQDGNLQEEFTIDGTGSYFYTQDISIPHHVFIQETESSISIRSDGSIEPETAPISRVGETYTLTNNIGESLSIQRSGITLDGDGYSITRGFGSRGVTAWYRSGVTIKNLNIKGFRWGIYLFESNDNTIMGNTVSGSGYRGIYLYHSDSNVITGNMVSNNDQDGIHITFSESNSIMENTVSNNYIGIYQSGDTSTISGNTVFDNRDYGILLSGDSSTVTNNMVLNNWQGIFVSGSNNKLRNNVMTSNTYNFGVQWSTHDIDTSNTVNGKPIYYWVDRHYETVPSDAGYVAVLYSDHITIQDCTLSNNRDGIYFSYTFDSMIENVEISENFFGIQSYFSSSNSISGNTVLNNKYGIYLGYCNSNTVSGNTVSNNMYGIRLSNSDSNIISGNTVSGNTYGIPIYTHSNSNTISGNTVSNNDYGIWLEWYSDSNIFYHNNFISNAYQVSSYYYSSPSTWDNSAGEGNYWSDYTGSDTNNDGIGDTLIPHPYTDQGNGYYQLDNYPFMYESGWVYGNTPPGTNVPVTFPEEGVTLTFQKVYPGGITTCTVTETGPPPPTGYRLIPFHPPTYYEITTTATYTGLITICINYDDSDLKLGQEKNLNLRQYDEATSEWGVITKSRNIDDNIICGETDHLSFFAIMLRLNDPPIAEDGGPYETDEDTAIVITLTASDANSDELTYEVVDDPLLGTLSGTAPDLIYTPNSDIYGSDSFTFKANDGTLDSNIATVSITINPVNDPAVAEDQSVTTNEDTPVAVMLQAYDIDGDTLTYIIVTNPSSGTLSGTPPSLTYTPNANYNGADSFTFKANDGGLHSNTATVTITINPVNDAPAADDQAVTTDEDTAVDIMLTANDVDGDPLTYIIGTGPSFGTLSGSAANLIYTPNADKYGSDSFTFKVNDGELDSNFATVSITVNPVNDAPMAYYQTVTTDEDTALSMTLIASDIDSVILTYSIVDNPLHGTLMGTLPNIIYTPDENYYGSDSFTFKVNDGELDSNIATVSITINSVNDVPVVSDIADQTIYEGDTFISSGSFTDPDLDTWAATVDYGDWSGVQTLILNPDKTFNLNHVYVDDDNDDLYLVTVTISDGNGGIDTNLIAVTVNNVAPTIAAVGGIIDENDVATVSGTITDPGILDTFTVVIDWGEGTPESFSYPLGTTFYSEEQQYLDDNPTGTTSDDYAISVIISDDDGGVGTASTTVTVNNVDPEITNLTLPVDPVDINIPVELTGEFTDTGSLDTHTAIIDWGDGNVDSIEEVTSPIPKQTHTYDLPGVYTITLTVKDDDDGIGTETFRYVVVYDPEGGFVTGGGWINSPVGAYAADPNAEGKANFGFVSKYKKGATTPTGNTEFQFKAGNLNFHSDNQEWLVIVVAGAKAQFKGSGTINGAGNYGFKLTAIDGELNGGGGTDKFRIKIWDKDMNVIVYDNLLGADDDADPTTILGGGQIKIHKV